MGREWKTIPLSRLYEFRSGLSKPKSEFGYGYPFLSFKDVFYNIFLPNNLSELVNSTESERENGSIQRGDVFVTRTSETMEDLGMSSVALKDYPNATFNGFTKRLRPLHSSEILPEYAGYFFRSSIFRRNITAMSSLSTRASLNNEMLGRLEMVLPSLDIQKSIAKNLKVLDDKIELNRRMNRTLEQMAAAIFKSWFIDFDPVHAKANSDPTAGGLPPHIAKLFPDTFQDSELGDIPAGWKAGKLGDIANNPRRTVDPSSVTINTPYIGLQDMPRNCIALDTWGQAEEVSSTKSQFNEGEILFGKLRPYFHKVGIAPVAGVCSTDILILVEKTREWHSFVLTLVSSKAFIDYTDAHSAGTKMPRTNWKDMSNYPIALPSSQLADAFQNHVSFIHNRITSSIHESRTLSQLRDTLLPKLLSGELALQETESMAKEAGS